MSKGGACVFLTRAFVSCPEQVKKHAMQGAGHLLHARQGHDLHTLADGRVEFNFTIGREFKIVNYFIDDYTGKGQNVAIFPSRNLP